MGKIAKNIARVTLVTGSLAAILGARTFCGSADCDINMKYLAEDNGYTTANLEYQLEQSRALDQQYNDGVLSYGEYITASSDLNDLDIDGYMHGENIPPRAQAQYERLKDSKFRHIVLASSLEGVAVLSFVATAGAGFYNKKKEQQNPEQPTTPEPFTEF